jgi:hypothetical protein
MLLMLITINTKIYATDVPANTDEDGFFLTGLMRSARWGRTFWADINPTLVNAEISFIENSPEYDWAGTDQSYRAFLFSNLGVNLPIWSSDFSGGKFGISLTVPFIINLWMDVFEQVTRPIINTDYRFGALGIAFIHRLQSPPELFPRWGIGIYNYSIKFSPYIHESTHIGDELTIYRKDTERNITRVNVSYNFSELVLTMNDPENSLKINHALRFGFMLLHNIKKGWYTVMPEEADTQIIHPSQFPYEFYFQYQFQSNSFWKGCQFIFSLETRFRERYNYPFSYYFSDDRSEFMDRNYTDSGLQCCYNILTGIRYNNPKLNYFSKIGLALRLYTGINPHGQFRSQLLSNNYLGIVVMFE